MDRKTTIRHSSLLFRPYYIKRHPKCLLLAAATGTIVLFNMLTLLPVLNVDEDSFEDSPVLVHGSATNNTPQPTPFYAVVDLNPEDPETLAHRPYLSSSSIPLAAPKDDQQLGYYTSREWMYHWINHQEGRGKEEAGTGSLSPALLEAIRLDLTKTLPLRFDHVYTWVNGSDPRLLPIRKHYQERSPVYKSYRRRQRGYGFLFGKGGDRKESLAKRFRDLDELRYSVRSVAMHTQSFLRNIHLFTTNVAEAMDEEESADNDGSDGSDGDQQDMHRRQRLEQQQQGAPPQLSNAGQAPLWLDSEVLGRRHDFRISHHASVFDTTENLPTFNSLAIESQLYLLPDISDIFVYMNDDTFYDRPLSPIDLWTPLYGFVFRFESSLMVKPIKPHPLDDNSASTADQWLAEVDGEWNSLFYSNFLLSKQFGARPRAYVAHIPHILSQSILREMAAVWPDQVQSTSSHRFRGEGQGRDIHTTFMMAHYVAERLRETQLRSFWQHVLDANHDGHLDWPERRWLVDRVREWNAYQQDQQQRHQDALDRSGVWRPIHQNHTRPSFLHQADATLGQTKLGWDTTTTAYTASGMDGVPFMHQGANTSHPFPHTAYQDKDRNPLPPTYGGEPPSARSCILNLDFCLGTQFSDPIVSSIPADQSARLFDRMAFQHYHCGDCLLLFLLQHRDLGLARAILPRDRRSPAYAQVVRDLARYNYVVGASSYAFVTLQDSQWQNQLTLDKLTAAAGQHSFFCVNDNMPDSGPTEAVTRPAFLEFLNRRFPNPSPWEVPPSLNLSSSSSSSSSSSASSSPSSVSLM